MYVIQIYVSELRTDKGIDDLHGDVFDNHAAQYSPYIAWLSQKMTINVSIISYEQLTLVAEMAGVDRQWIF
jgi:hypothetical protein